MSSMVAKPILLALLLNTCKCFFFDSKPTDNTIDQNSIEYDDIDPSVEIDVDEIMKQKTDNDFDDKMEKETNTGSFPYFVVLSQSGKKNEINSRPNTSLKRRQGGFMQGITDAVANTRFITSPASMASLLGVGILQFIGSFILS